LALVEELNEYMEHAITKINTIYTGLAMVKATFSKRYDEEYPDEAAMIEKILEDLSEMFLKFCIKTAEFENELHLNLWWSEFTSGECKMSHIYIHSDSRYENLTEKKLIFNLTSFFYEIKIRINTISVLIGDFDIIDLESLYSIISKYVDS